MTPTTADTTAWAHACHMIWDLAGQPTTTDPTRDPGLCAMCGHTRPLAMTLGPNFTDYRTLTHTNQTHLCDACSWVFSGKPPNTLRMWSLVARTDQPAPPVVFDKPPYVSAKFLQLTNRKDMRWLAATLANPPATPWLVAVAETGQKHTAPFTPINPPRSEQWTVRSDGATITATPTQWVTVLSHTAALRAAGHSAPSIEAGQPTFAALKKSGPTLWRTHATPLAPYLGAPLLHLANQVITKETNEHYTHTYPA